jgi:sigma-B regulation protein RsbU (phosphoserine phosphatase)
MKGHDPSLGRTVIDDLRRARLQRLGEEFRELYYFYLDEEARNRLAGMGRIRRAFLLLGWLLKSLLMKLSPARRIMLLVALVFTVLGKTGLGFTFGGWALAHDLRPWGFLLLLIVLMLELKDKLLAKDEIQIAREVQVALLPHEEAEIPGWSVWSCSRPANDVGGDLVDYIDLDGFRHGVVLGDVAGKGLGAALLSAKLQATLRALVPEAASLDDLASRVNTIFFRDGLENRYATLFYAELEYDSGQLRYLNAGHNPAFAIQADGSRKLGASSLPLGMLPSSNYEECTLQFEPGEMLLAYSDGLTEAENAAGEEFGLQRIEALLPELVKLEPPAIGRRLLKEVDRFVGDVRPRDDLSLVVIRRQATRS